MAIAMYLAMTAAEFSTCEHLPAHIAWLACHFSPSGPGLSNMPKSLPAHSLLMVDDSIPFQNHQPDYILQQLQEAISAFDVQAIILDLQRPRDPDVQALVARLQQALPCPVAAPPEYALEDSPAFLPPCPLNKPLKEYLSPYQGRQVWLDAAPLPIQITVTAGGCTCQTLPVGQSWDAPHQESTLHCNYSIAPQDDRIIFTLRRDADAFCDWLQEAESLGVTAAIGLYQEWR